MYNYMYGLSSPFQIERNETGIRSHKVKSNLQGGYPDPREITIREKHVQYIPQSVARAMEHLLFPYVGGLGVDPNTKHLTGNNRISTKVGDL